MRVRVDKIVVPDERARARYTDEQKAYLRASLGKYGQLSDILVRPLEGDRYELIDGESRLRELADGGATDVDVKVLDLDNRDSALVNILMNVARGDQDPMGVSLSLGKALEAGMAEEEIAGATGHSVQWVRFMLMLRTLPAEYQDALREDRLKVTHIREAGRLPNPKEMDAALGASLRFGWNTAVMKNYVDNRLQEYLAAEIMKERTGVAVPPPEPEPQRLARYAQCLVCGEMVEKERLNLPRVCDACYTFAKYAVSQTGKGEEGMQRLFKALELQQAYDQRQRQFFLERDLERAPLEGPADVPRVPEAALEVEGPIVKPEWMSPEAWGRIKAMIRAERP